MSKPPFIHRVKLRNYKSIARCDVQLGPLGILVGPNGSGKSNFLDALSLTRQALATTLDHALRDRGGINEVRRRSGGHPANFEIGLDFMLPNGGNRGCYGFEIASRRDGGFAIRKEYCEVGAGEGEDAASPARFEIKDGEVVENSLEVRLPRPAPDRLFLVNASNVDEFRPVYDALTDMRFYNGFSLQKMRQPQPVGAGDILYPDGSNLVNVLSTMERADPHTLKHISALVGMMTPGFDCIATERRGNLEMLYYWQHPSGAEARRFPVSSLSDGSLRGLAMLSILLPAYSEPPSLLAISEPETGWHPDSLGVLWDAIDFGDCGPQTLITTHSPDLLECDNVPVEAFLATSIEGGRTEVGPIVQKSRELLQGQLATPGELLRQGRLSSKEGAIYPQSYLPAYFPVFRSDV